MAQAQPEFGLTLPILLLCCAEFLKRALEIWRPWSINCDGRGPSRVLSGFGYTEAIQFDGLSASRSLGATPQGVSVHHPSTLRFDTYTVVDCSADPLFTTKVALSGLNRNVTEEELDLFQFSACCVT